MGGIRTCRCPDGCCFDLNIKCPECDEEGYPYTARRRLKRSGDGVFEDIDDRQKFKVKKTKTHTGNSLIPVFCTRVDWKGSNGFAAMALILSCLGTDGEYVMWNESTKQGMDVCEWEKRTYKAKSKVPVLHLKCGETTKKTSINNLKMGRCVGCTCDSVHWRSRRPEAVVLGKNSFFDVATTEKEWIDECSGCDWCPKLLCLKCKEKVQTTSIRNLQQGRGVGCTCDSVHWRSRRPEAVVLGKNSFFDVATTEKEWIDECSGCDWCPKLLCLKCKEKVQTTSIRNLQQGRGVGCKGCRNKTEAKLNTWIVDSFPDASIEWGTYKGPMLDGQTHFDFHLTFTNGFEVLVELDGAQHFWKNSHFYTEEGCKRDFDKEEWAIKQGLCVVRVLQEDVWDDKLGWQDFLKRNINAARAGEARVLKPDAPEYTSSESGYVSAHMREMNDEVSN